MFIFFYSKIILNNKQFILHFEYKNELNIFDNIKKSIIFYGFRQLHLIVQVFSLFNTFREQET